MTESQETKDAKAIADLHLENGELRKDVKAWRTEALGLRSRAKFKNIMFGLACILIIVGAFFHTSQLNRVRVDRDNSWQRHLVSNGWGEYVVQDGNTVFKLKDASGGSNPGVQSTIPRVEMPESDGLALPPGPRGKWKKIDASQEAPERK